MGVPQRNLSEEPGRVFTRISSRIPSEVPPEISPVTSLHIRLVVSLKVYRGVTPEIISRVLQRFGDELA